jgi:hypothetical protein
MVIRCVLRDITGFLEAWLWRWSSGNLGHLLYADARGLNAVADAVA